MRHYYLGMAANYKGGDWLKNLFTFGSQKDAERLTKYLGEKYSGEAMLCKNGRSALALAFKAYFDPGDAVVINGFTCYAVYEAVKAAKLTPVFTDISLDDLNYDYDKLPDEARIKREKIKGIVVQNTLGNPVDIKKLESYAKKNDLMIIEDLAHCAGVKYSDGREAGTIGVATALSFGKDKSIDTISGGAVILREPTIRKVSSPSKAPKLSDHLRARFYPMLAGMCRGLTYIHLGGALMRVLVKIHFVERSADNRLDLERRPSRFEAKLALEQFKALKQAGEPPIRGFYYVEDRPTVLKQLQKRGYYFGGFWYEKPVSPARYYSRVHFPEDECPNAVYAASHIINLPNYYKKSELKEAVEIIKEHIKEGKDE